MSELFNENEVASKSPRLLWIEKHDLEFHESELVDPPWCCWSNKDGNFDELDPESQMGYGLTENDAIADWATRHGKPLWNEVPVLMPVQTDLFLRPSLLPKLALCGHFRSGEVGEAAERGTRIDGLFRGLLTPGSSDLPFMTADEDEANAAEWAANTARAFAGSLDLDATEEGCQVSVDIEKMMGTADVVCREGRWSADLKSGQKRSYEAQQACYALGFMDDLFVDEWTVYLFYCDLETVETLRFTRESAIECIHDALALWRGKVPPTPNPYCGWCAKKFACDEYARSLGFGIIDELPVVPFTDMASEDIAAFALWMKEMEDWVSKAREVLRGRLSKEKVAGCKLVSKRGSRKVEAEALLRARPDLAPQIAALAGRLSEKEAVGIWPELPAELVTEAPGRTELHISKPKG